MAKTTNNTEDTTAVMEKPKRGRPKKDAAAPVADKAKAPKTIKVKHAPAEAPATEKAAYEGVYVPMDRIKVDYSANPRFAGKGVREDHEVLAALLVDDLKANGQYVPGEGFYPGNDEGQDLVLTEGFVRYTALSMAGAPAMLIHVIEDPQDVDRLLGRQIGTNMNQNAYTLASILANAKKMLSITDASGKKMKKKEIAALFGISDQTFSRIVTVLESDHFAHSVETGALALDTAYNAVLKMREVADELAASAGRSKPTPEDLKKAEEAVKQKVEQLGDSPTAKQVKQALDDDGKWDNPIPAANPSTPKGNKLNEVLDKLTILEDLVNNYVKGKKTVHADALPSLLTLISGALMGREDFDPAADWAVVEAYLEDVEVS